LQLKDPANNKTTELHQSFFYTLLVCASALQYKVMIRAYIGEDTLKAREVMRAAVAHELAQNGDVLVSRFSEISFDATLAAEALGAQNLFGGGNIVVFEALLDHPLGEEFYRTMLPKTQNTVFMRETEGNKDFLVFLKAIAEVQEFSLVKKFKKPENSFAIADAIGARDKKAAWVEFEKVRRQGAAMEEVHGTIFWAVKSMYIAATLPKEEAMATGMKDYTHRTYLNFSKKYLIPELKEKLGELKEMYHLAHRGEGDLDTAIELFLLRL
jgi:DNA polymerase III delta subunit